MKSPWKFLSQLTSRKRPSDAPDLLIGHDGDRKPAEHEALPLAAPGETAGRGREDGLQADLATSTADSGPEGEAAGTASLPSGVEERQLDVVDDTPVANAPEPSSGERKPVLKSAKPKRNEAPRGPKADAADAIATNEDQPAESASSDKPAFDGAADLDMEIKQLRRQLAQKLQSQNAQLREMLTRFDRS